MAVEWVSTIAQQRGLDTGALLRGDRPTLERMIAETLAHAAHERAQTLILQAGDEPPPVPRVRPGHAFDAAVARLVAAERDRRQAIRDAETERRMDALMKEQG
jgi:hypothetical protein